jgi:hypothetical protein
MGFKSELKIRAAWRIVASGHEQWEETGSIEPEHLDTVCKVQIEIAQQLARFEDGLAVLSTPCSTRRQLRHIEQSASDLICLSEQCAVAHLMLSAVVRRSAICDLVVGYAPTLKR